jgi:hypothetical protein
MTAMSKPLGPLIEKSEKNGNLYTWTPMALSYSILLKISTPSSDKVRFPCCHTISICYADESRGIRSAILEGEIDKALKFLNTYYPHVLEREENRDVYFKLRCRKFIEMICRVNDLSTQDPPPMAPKAAGKLPQHSSDSNGAIFDHQMELDDQLHRESRAPVIPPMPVPSPFNPGLRFGDGANGNDGKDDTMDTAPDGIHLVSSSMDSEQLLVDALEFGQELKAEFNDDPRPAVRKALDDTFALIAYQDARESIVGGLMEGKGRVEIAEEVNSAILGTSSVPHVRILLIGHSVTRQAIFRSPRESRCPSRSSGRPAEFGRRPRRICQCKKGLSTIRHATMHGIRVSMGA